MAGERERGGRERGGRDREERDSEFVDKLVHINRVAKVVKGGKRFGFAALVVIGDQKANREMFERMSPARYVSKIQGPVFHAYGGEDRNVDIENGRVIRAAFERAGKAHEWMFVADEGHGYRLDKNVFEFYKRFDAFIKKNTPNPR